MAILRMLMQRVKGIIMGSSALIMRTLTKFEFSLFVAYGILLYVYSFFYRLLSTFLFSF